MLGQYTLSLRVEALEGPGTVDGAVGLGKILFPQNNLHQASFGLISISFKIELSPEDYLNSLDMYSLE